MQPRTAIGIVSGFAALFTSTLGGTALACTDPSANAAAVRSADSAGAFDFGVQPVKDATRLSSYSSFEHEAVDALTAKAGELAAAISTAQDNGAPARLVDRARAARAAALAHLSDAKAALAVADSALSEGRNNAAATQLRLAAGHLHAAAFKLGFTRMLVGAAMHAAFLAAKAARLADAKASLASAELKSFNADSVGVGHHCDGRSGDARWGDARWGDGHHDSYHHDWHR